LYYKSLLCGVFHAVSYKFQPLYTAVSETVRLCMNLLFGSGDSTLLMRTIAFNELTSDNISHESPLAIEVCL